MCFIMWFAIPPLMPTIKKPKCLEATSPTCVNCMADFASDLLAMGKDAVCKVCAPRDTRNNAGCGGLGLVQSQIVLSNATSVMGTIIIRILIGSLADGIGVRWSYIGLLTICSIPGFCVSGELPKNALWLWHATLCSVVFVDVDLSGFSDFAVIRSLRAAAVQTVDQFIALRFLISFVGGSFVLTQLWTSVMFSASIVGTANATTAGWGNLGGGIALAVMPKVFQSLIDSGFDNEYAWRYTLIWPPAVLLALAVGIYFLTDDTPVGRYSEQRAKIKAMKADPNYIDDGKVCCLSRLVLPAMPCPSNFLCNPVLMSELFSYPSPWPASRLSVLTNVRLTGYWWRGARFHRRTLAPTRRCQLAHLGALHCVRVLLWRGGCSVLEHCALL